MQKNRKKINDEVFFRCLKFDRKLFRHAKPSSQDVLVFEAEKAEYISSIETLNLIILTLIIQGKTF